MKAYLDCYPCFLRQALGAARRAGGDEKRSKVFCLLQVKCPVIARGIGAAPGAAAVFQGRSGP